MAAHGWGPLLGETETDALHYSTQCVLRFFKSGAMSVSGNPRYHLESFLVAYPRLDSQRPPEFSTAVAKRASYLAAKALDFFCEVYLAWLLTIVRNMFH